MRSCDFYCRSVSPQPNLKCHQQFSVVASLRRPLAYTRGSVPPHVQFRTTKVSYTFRWAVDKPQLPKVLRDILSHPADFNKRWQRPLNYSCFNLRHNHSNVFTALSELSGTIFYLKTRSSSDLFTAIRHRSTRARNGSRTRISKQNKGLRSTVKLCVLRKSFRLPCD